MTKQLQNDMQTKAPFTARIINALRESNKVAIKPASKQTMHGDKVPTNNTELTLPTAIELLGKVGKELLLEALSADADSVTGLASIFMPTLKYASESDKLLLYKNLVAELEHLQKYKCYSFEQVGKPQYSGKPSELKKYITKLWVYFTSRYNQDGLSVSQQLTPTQIKEMSEQGAITGTFNLTSRYALTKIAQGFGISIEQLKNIHLSDIDVGNLLTELTEDKAKGAVKLFLLELEDAEIAYEAELVARKEGSMPSLRESYIEDNAVYGTSALTGIGLQMRLPRISEGIYSAWWSLAGLSLTNLDLSSASDDTLAKLSNPPVLKGYGAPVGNQSEFSTLVNAFDFATSDAVGMTVFEMRNANLNKLKTKAMLEVTARIRKAQDEASQAQLLAEHEAIINSHLEADSRKKVLIEKAHKDELTSDEKSELASLLTA